MGARFDAATSAGVRSQGCAAVGREVGLRTVPRRDCRGETVAALDVGVHAARMPLDRLL